MFVVFQNIHYSQVQEKKIHGLQFNPFFSRLQMVSLLMLSFQEIQLCLKSYHLWIIACNRKQNYDDTKTSEYLKLTSVLRTQDIKSFWDLQHWVVTSLRQII